ncbi:MAG TPA: acyltransferase [Aeromicrobium sp.]|nr:acyltransferase [Aeromicrobium sp.]
MGHLRLVHGLRAVAALLVLLSHVGFWTGATRIDFVGGLIARGDAGVAVFFAISAFLLLRPAIRRGFEGNDSKPDPGRYAARRSARILPAYWLTLAAVLIAAASITGAGGLGGFSKVASNVLLLQGYTGDYYQSFTQTWSLTTEVTFYFFVPLLSLLLVRLITRHDHVQAVRSVGRLFFGAALVGLLAQAAATSWTLAGSTSGAGVLATSVLGHLAWFTAGAGVAFVVEARNHGVGPLASESLLAAVFQSRTTLVLGAVVVFSLASSPLAGPRDLTAPTIGQSVFKELAYALFALLLLAAAADEPKSGTSANTVASSPVTKWLGDISYGIFLWHVLVLQLVFAASGATLFATGFWWVLYAVLGFTIALASASWILLERPILKAVRNRTSHGSSAKA